MSKIKIFALGGLNENGKNMYVVEVDKSIFVFDAGLKYANDKMLGVDYIIPNIDYLKETVKSIYKIDFDIENATKMPDFYILLRLIISSYQG